MIAKNLGHLDDFNEATRFFKANNIINHNYVIIRLEVPALPTTPKCYSNMFLEIEGLKKAPLFFGPPCL